MVAVCIIVPVLRRPHRVNPLLASIAQATPEPHTVLFVADANDVEERVALDRAHANYVTTTEPPPNYPAKVNLAYRETSEPFLFLAADDLHFHYGWLRAALTEMRGNVAVVGTNDGGVNQRVARGEHATHMLVRRAYVDEHGATFDQTPGVLVHEGYGHVYVDDELVQTAQARQVYAHAHDSLVEHLHPYGGKARTDATYRIGREPIAADKALYQERRELRRRLRWIAPSWSEPSVTLPG